MLPRSMVLDISTLFVAARAMGRVLFIIGVGSAAAQSGLLDKPARSCLANFNLNLFFPALYISVAGHYGAYDLIRYAPLWIGSLLHIALGYGLALVTARLFGLQQQDKTFVLIMTAFGNCGGLPFVLMQAVCSSSWERVADMHEPVARAFVMMCARRPCVRRAQPLVAVAIRWPWPAAAMPLTQARSVAQTAVQRAVDAGRLHLGQGDRGARRGRADAAPLGAGQRSSVRRRRGRRRRGRRRRGRAGTADVVQPRGGPRHGATLALPRARQHGPDAAHALLRGAPRRGGARRGDPNPNPSPNPKPNP